MDTLFKSSSNFSSLSLKDLIEARDLFHYHLMNKKNVVATALGLYRIRKDDEWPTRHDPQKGVKKKRAPKSERRTLFNSEVRPYSWPCVYVFVSNWQYEEDLAGTDPSDVVPETLYLPDGRTIPVCVIEALKQPFAKDLKVDRGRLPPRNLLGPGTALENEGAQNMPRAATAGCIVRDGDNYYVLTNRHATGEPGTEIKALQAHRADRIGVAAEKGLTRVDLQKVYPNFHSTNQRLLMDIGLIKVDDITKWKTAIPGIAPVGPVLDLYDNSLSLQLLTMKVVGRSAFSGLIHGEIHGLLYRYKSMGGSEYIADFLIGPETYTAEGPMPASDEAAQTNIALGIHHGDSGTMLLIRHVEKDDRQAQEQIEPGAEVMPPHKAKQKTTYYPFALLWGKEEFFDDGGELSHPYALATALSTALDRLDLDLVRDINRDQNYVWGWVGHYVIGRQLAVPADLVTSAKLQDLIKKNLDRLAVEPDDALGNDPKVRTSEDDDPNFVPLADVPDNVWKSNVNFVMVDKKHKAGPGNRAKNDNPNHFADLDLPYDGAETFLELNVSDPDTYLNPKAWIAYFASLKPRYEAWADALEKPADDRSRKDNHWGALPFRVHQLFDIMKAAASAGNQKMFLSAGGVLIHYVGDACQPLHTSYLSQGDPDRVVRGPKSGKPKLEADTVHGGYEDDMVEYGLLNGDLAAKLKHAVAHPPANEPHIMNIQTGYDASKAIIALIAATRKQIKPADIVKKYVELKGQDRKANMWEAFGDDTIACMARGTRYLAKIWQAAWTAGDGDTHMGAIVKARTTDLMNIYNNPAQLPSVALNHYPDDKDADWAVAVKYMPPKHTPAAPP